MSFDIFLKIVGWMTILVLGWIATMGCIRWMLDGSFHITEFEWGGIAGAALMKFQDYIYFYTRTAKP
jgi:hypothetical protein